MGCHPDNFMERRQHKRMSFHCVDLALFGKGEYMKKSFIGAGSGAGEPDTFEQGKA